MDVVLCTKSHPPHQSHFGKQHLTEALRLKLNQEEAAAEAKISSTVQADVSATNVSAPASVSQHCPIQSPCYYAFTCIGPEAKHSPTNASLS